MITVDPCSGSLGVLLMQAYEWDTRFSCSTSWTDGWQRKVGGERTKEFKCKAEPLLYFPQQQETKHGS